MNGVILGTESKQIKAMDKLSVRIYHEGVQVATFRKLDDFYRVTGEEARLMSSILGIPLFKQNGSDICGFPAHTKRYFDALRKANYEVE